MEKLEIAGKFTIRELRESDISQIVDMSREHFPTCLQVTRAYLYETIEELYLNDRSAKEDIISLVATNDEDNVHGFLGITPKIFLYKGEPVLAGHCNHLMASTEARSALVPMRLLQKFLAGPQDFSFSDGSVNATRFLWNRLGGQASFSHSIYYKIPLRYLSFGTRPLSNRLPFLFRKSIRRISYGADFLLNKARLPFSSRKKPDSELFIINPEEILAGLNGVWKKYDLVPYLSVEMIRKLLALLEKDKRNGTLNSIGIRNKRQQLTGWFLYYATNEGVCEVLQAVSMPGQEAELFDAICWHAYQNKGTELSGRALPSQIGSEFITRGFSMPGRMWTLFHTNNTDLETTMLSDRAFVTRLDGDLWLI